MKAMILSAGKGERLKPLTDTTPKPLIKIGKKRLIEYLLLQLAQSGFKDIIINIAYHPEQFLDILGDGGSYGVTIHYLVEPYNQPLGTGGGIQNALPLLNNQPFLVVSGDIWTDYPFSRLCHHKLGKHLAHLVVINPTKYLNTADFHFNNQPVIYGNIGIYSPSLFNNRLNPCSWSIGPLLKQSWKSGIITAERYTGLWHNVGDLATLNIVSNHYQHN